MNFQGFNSSKLLTKKSTSIAQEMLEKSAKVGVPAATFLAVVTGKAEKPVSKLTALEMVKEYDEIPENSNFMTDAEKQRSAELIGRMSSLGLVKHDELQDYDALTKQMIKEYNDIPENPAFMTDAEKQKSAELISRMSAFGLVKNGELI
jgi:hypothetical protein